jgi:hypothetical protein
VGHVGERGAHGAVVADEREGVVEAKHEHVEGGAAADAGQSRAHERLGLRQRGAPGVWSFCAEATPASPQKAGVPSGRSATTSGL